LVREKKKKFYPQIQGVTFIASAPSTSGSPLAHEEVALRDNRPKAFREAFLPSSGPGGYLSPTTPDRIRKMMGWVGCDFSPMGAQWALEYYFEPLFTHDFGLAQ
jgi:hypothetical protein